MRGESKGVMRKREGMRGGRLSTGFMRRRREGRGGRSGRRVRGVVVRVDRGGLGIRGGTRMPIMGGMGAGARIEGAMHMAYG